MPTLDDIKDSAISRLDAPKGQVVNALNVLPELDSPERGFRFVLQQFGMERVNVNRYSPGKVLDGMVREDTNQGGSVAYQDKGVTTMHTGAGDPPQSILGTPVFCDMILTAPANKLNSNVSSIHLLNVITSVEQTKNIVKTTVQGLDGTVKEYISDGDYMVSIRGVIYNSFRKDYPKQVVQQLRAVFKRKQALDVTSEYLRLFGVYSLVVESFKMAQEMGRQNMQKFEAVCSSDLPLLLKRKAR